MNWEIEYASKHEKTIVGVWERGSRGCELPEALEEHYDAIVGWHSENIIDAINGVYRGTSHSDGTPTNEKKPIKRHPC